MHPLSVVLDLGELTNDGISGVLTINAVILDGSWIHEMSPDALRGLKNLVTISTAVIRTPLDVILPAVLQSNSVTYVRIRKVRTDAEREIRKAKNDSLAASGWRDIVKGKNPNWHKMKRISAKQKELLCIRSLVGLHTRKACTSSIFDIPEILNMPRTLERNITRDIESKNEKIENERLSQSSTRKETSKRKMLGKKHRRNKEGMAEKSEMKPLDKHSHKGTEHLSLSTMIKEMSRKKMLDKSRRRKREDLAVKSEKKPPDKHSGKGPEHHHRCPEQSWISSPYSIATLIGCAIGLLILAIYIPLSVFQMRRLNKKIDHQQMMQEKEAAEEEQSRVEKIQKTKKTPKESPKKADENFQLVQQDLQKNNSRKLSDTFIATPLLSNKNEKLMKFKNSKANQSGNASTTALLAMEDVNINDSHSRIVYDIRKSLRLQRRRSRAEPEDFTSVSDSELSM